MIKGSDFDSALNTETSTRSVRKDLYIPVLLIVLYVIVRGLACWSIALYDDAFITFKYAENFAGGKGFTYNPGAPVLGTTTPLFAIFLAAFKTIGFSLPVVSRLISFISELFLLWMFWQSAKVDKVNNAILFITALTLTDPFISRIAVGGMESVLFVAVSVWAFYLLLRGSANLALILAALSVWLRPEGVLTFAIVAGYGLLKKKKFHWYGFIAAGLVIVLPAFLLYSYFGSALPQSVAAKSESIGSPFLYVVNLFLGWDRDPFQFLLTITTVILLPIVLKRSAFCRLLGVWAGLYLIAYLLARPQVWSWYALPVYYYKCLVTGFGFAIILERIRAYVSVKKIVPGLAFIMPLVLWGGIALKVGEAPSRIHVFQPLEQFCKANVTASDSLYTQDIGAAGYYSDAFILDHFGLVWPDIVNYRPWQNLLKELRPKWAMIVTRNQYREYVADEELIDIYRPVARMSKYGTTDFSPDTTSLKRGWTHDYIMLKRVD